MNNFYPRPPRGGRPVVVLVEPSSQVRFLSTPSARRATGLGYDYYTSHKISIHALREEGDIAPKVFKPRAVSISIHALREEGDRWCCRRSLLIFHFYPRPPRGGRLFNAGPGNAPDEISIHALREEGDKGAVSHWYEHRYFYPRPPRGGRRTDIGEWTDTKGFLSTPSARRATTATSACPGR